MNERAVERDKPVLIVVEGPLRDQQAVMHGEQLIIGRGPESDMVIPDRRVSREHVRLWREGARCMIEDLGSKNGTYVNGERLESPRELRDGDEIQIALAVKLRYIGSDATVPLTIDEYPVWQTGLRLDERTREVLVGNEVLTPQLSLYQYRLLQLLYERRGAICTRDDVVRAVWPEAVEEGISEQAIDALVRRLRDRLAEIDPDHQYIVTVRGHGFRFEQPGDPRRV